MSDIEAQEEIGGVGNRVVRLDEMDATEWFDAALRINPHLSREQFNEDWREFVRLKRLHSLS